MSASHPPYPTLPGYTVRAYRDEADVPALLAVMTADQQSSRREELVTLPQLVNYYRHGANCHPPRDVLLIEDAQGLAAFGRVEWHKEHNADAYQYLLGAHVRPDLHGQGLGTALLAWLEQRGLTMAAELGHPPTATRHWQAGARDRDPRKQRLLERAGYTPIRYFYRMVRPDLEIIPDKRLPAGLEVRPVQPEHYRAIWDAATEAFKDHWNEPEVTEADYQLWLGNPREFQPHIWKIAWDVAKNEVAGMVMGYIVDEENQRFQRKRGWTENIAVRRPYRKQGVASALIAENLRELKARGMTEAALGVDSSSPTGALGVYEAMGFRPVERMAVYRKPLPRES